MRIEEWLIWSEEFREDFPKEILKEFNPQNLIEVSQVKVRRRQTVEGSKNYRLLSWCLVRWQKRTPEKCK